MCSEVDNEVRRKERRREKTKGGERKRKEGRENERRGEKTKGGERMLKSSHVLKPLPPYTLAPMTSLTLISL